MQESKSSAQLRFAAVDTSDDDSSWYGLRVDDTALYYFHAGAIIRRLK